MSDKIPTAEEIYKQEVGEDFEDYNQIFALREFARLHVEAALKAAHENGVIKEDYLDPNDSKSLSSWIDKDSILNAYPKENII